MLDKLVIGSISSTHGLKGDVNVYPLTDEPERFADLEDVLLSINGSERKLHVEHVTFFKGKPIVRFQGIDSIEKAQQLRGGTLMVPREEAIPLLEGEYFIGDLVGSDIVLEDESKYGVLEDILRTGANDVYVIRKEDGSTAMIPAVREFVPDVDASGKKITIRPMKEI